MFPLVVFLLSLQFTLSLEKIVSNYEKNLVEDYGIIVVCVKNLNVKKLKKDISDFRSITPVSADKILDQLKGDISTKNLSLLKMSLPKFYSLKLTRFPSTKKLNEIKKKLSKYSSVTKVETFSKTHDKIYHIFSIANLTSYIFTAFILIITFLLMLKQIRIWVYEHKERMDIMSLFGASFFMKSAVLYRLVILDSFISTAIVVCVYYFLPKLEYLQNTADNIGIKIPSIDIFSDGLFLLVVALFSAIFSVSLVMLRLRKD